MTAPADVRDAISRNAAVLASLANGDRRQPGLRVSVYHLGQPADHRTLERAGILVLDCPAPGMLMALTPEGRALLAEGLCSDCLQPLADPSEHCRDCQECSCTCGGEVG